MKLMKRMIALVAVLTLTVSHLGIAYAANGSNTPQASPTLTSYGVCLDPGDRRGELDISFDVTATGWASELGVAYIEIYDARSDTLVDSIHGTTGNGLTSSGFTYTNTYTYSGLTPGADYYAIVAIFAQIGTTLDSRTFRTPTVTAPKTP